jgi:hypothetical protein
VLAIVGPAPKFGRKGAKMGDFQHRWLIATLLAGLAACGDSASAPAANNAQKPAAVGAPALAVGKSRSLAEGWFEIRPEPGVSLLLRDGWTANRAEDANGPIVFSGPAGAQAMVWPMFIAAGAPVPAPDAVLKGFARQAAGRFVWEVPVAMGRSAVRMMGYSGSKVGLASFTYTKSPAGTVGYWYFASAPRDRYAAMQPIFAKLLQGVRFYGSAPSAAAAPRQAASALRFIAWREPNEGAYIAQVPQGWKVRGGIVRPDPLRLFDPIDMQSPDGQIYVFSGDRNLPLFKTPTQMEAQMGMGEGSNNGNAVLMRYRSAEQLLPDYIQRRFGQQCGGLQIKSIRNQPEVAEPYNRQLASGMAPGNFQHVDVALADFSCGDKGQGLIQMATFITGMNSQMGSEGFGMWQVSSVNGFIAPPQRMAEAGQAIIKLLTARQINPQWAQGNQQMVAQINTISQKAASEMSAQIARNAPSMSSNSSSSNSSTTSGAMSDDLSRQWQNSTLGQTDVVDQSSGTRYKVESGSNYYWINQAGTSIVGTNAPSQPGTDFNAMTQLP